MTNEKSKPRLRRGVYIRIVQAFADNRQAAVVGSPGARWKRFGIPVTSDPGNKPLPLSDAGRVVVDLVAYLYTVHNATSKTRLTS